MTNKTVYKFLLPLAGDVSTNVIYRNAKILHVGLQEGEPYVWMEVDLFALPGTYEFHCIGTGWTVPDNAQHIGTIIDDAAMVWHFYMSEK